MRLSFPVLFILAVFKSYSQEIEENGDPAPVNCDPSSKPQSSVSYKGVLTSWSSNFIYPVLVCAELKGKIKECNLSTQSRLILQVVLSAEKDNDLGTLANDFGSLVARIKPDDFSSSNRRCHLFHASDIAGCFGGQNLAGSQIGVSVFLFGDQEGPTIPTVHVTARAMLYNIREAQHTIIPLRTDKHKNHAVICSFPNCTVSAEGPYDATETERFRIVENKTPEYAEGDDWLDTGMFSVTYFECKSDCPTKFSAVDSSAFCMKKEAPPEETPEEEEEEEEEEEAEEEAAEEKAAEKKAAEEETPKAPPPETTVTSLPKDTAIAATEATAPQFPTAAILAGSIIAFSAVLLISAAAVVALGFRRGTQPRKGISTLRWLSSETVSPGTDPDRATLE